MSTTVTSLTSHFLSAEDGFTTALASTISSGATTVPLNSVAGYANGEVVAFTIDPTDATKKQVVVGIIDTSGVQLTSCVWVSGTNQSHTTGATVVDYADAAHISAMTKGILVSHNQDGTLKAQTNLALTTPKITTSINDSAGNEVIKTPATASAVNEITVTNAATGNAPTITATGGDTNIDLSLSGKGTGGVLVTNPYRFSAYKTADSTTVSTGTKMVYESELFDPNSNFDTSTYRYTAPKTGIYSIYATAYIASLNANARVQLYKNGSLLRSGNWLYDTSDGTPTINALLSLTAGDYLEVFVVFTGGGTRTMIGHTNVPGYPSVFEGYLLSV